MRNERRKTNDRVVAPIRAAVALPPGRADRVRPHAKSHAELEYSCKNADRWHADDQGLKNAKRWVCLRDAHQPQHCLGRHEAVCIHNESEIVALAPAVAEIADVARLESDIFLAPAVSDWNTVFPLCNEAVELSYLSRYNFGKTAIAQDVEV